MFFKAAGSRFGGLVKARFAGCMLAGKVEFFCLGDGMARPGRVLMNLPGPCFTPWAGARQLGLVTSWMAPMLTPLTVCPWPSVTRYGTLPVPVQVSAVTVRTK